MIRPPPTSTLFPYTTLFRSQLALRGVALLAVSQLARQAHRIEDAFSSRHFARLARRFTRPGGLDDLRGDDARIRRTLFEVRAQPLGDDLLDHRSHFGRNQLFLGLR